MSNSFSFTVFHSNWQYFTHSNSQQLTVIHCDEPNTGFEPRLISAYFFARWSGWRLLLRIDLFYLFSAQLLRSLGGSFMKMELIFQYGYGIMICKEKRFVFHNKSRFIKEDMDETVFMFALFKCRKFDKRRN